MRTLRQLAAVTLMGGLTTVGIGLAAGPASASISDCTGYLGRAQSGSLHLTSTPAGGSIVPVGSTLALSASWNDADFDETDRVLVCGSVDGAYNAGMSSEDKGVGNTGTDSASSVIPASAPVGSKVCVVAVLKGQSPAHAAQEMVSDTLCYTSAAVATTTTTTTAPPATTTTSTEPAPAVVPAGDNSGPGTEPAPAVEPATAEAPAPMPQLPRTGSGVGALAEFGALTLGIGALSRFLGRKRGSEA